MIKNIALGLTLAVTSLLSHAEPPAWQDGNITIEVDYKQEKMYCTHCGSTEGRLPISGPVPAFEGTGSGVQNYFKAQNILIVRTSMGSMCNAGGWYAIDLNARISKELTLPNCNEEKVSYSSTKDKAIMKVIQGKKITIFKF